MTVSTDNKFECWVVAKEIESDEVIMEEITLPVQISKAYKILYIGSEEDCEKYRLTYE